MKLLKHFVILTVSSLILAGCAYNGLVSNDFHKVYGNSERKTLAKVGLLYTKTPKSVKYGQTVDYTVKLDNSIYAFKNELASHFNEVEVIKDPSECKDCNVFAALTLGVKIFQLKNLYTGEAELDFISSDENAIASFTSETEGDATPPADVTASGILSQASLGLLSAVAIQKYGTFITDVTQQAVSEMASEIGRKVRRDKMLSYDAFDPSQQLQTETMQANAEYAKYEDAVVVLSTNSSLGSGFLSIIMA